MSYKEIKVKDAPMKEAHKTIEFEDDTIPQAEVEITPPDAETAPKVEPKPQVSRAQKRIKDLAAQKNELQFQLDQERKEKDDLRRQLLQGNTSTKESLKSSLEDAIKSLHTQTIDAMQSGDSEKAVELQDRLITAKMELKSLDYELKVDKQELAAPVIRQQAPPQISDKANGWIEDHPEFTSDEVFHAAAIAVNNQLLRDGFDANSDEFYEELSQKLSKRFPEVFGVPQQNSVILSNSDDSPEAEEGVKRSAPVVKSTTKARISDQVVSGSSRPSANVIQKKNATQVELSAQDVKQAEAWGWSLERMARRIAHKENNTRTDGYVSIMIPNNPA
jgi:hypothetical protein